VTKPQAARSVAIVALLCIGATACGGSKSNSSSAAPGTTNAGGTAAGGTATTVPVVKPSGNGGGFCKLEGDSMKKAESGVATGAGTSPAALRKQYQTLRQTEQPAIDSAPGELKADLNLLLEASVKYGEELAKVDFDVTRVIPAAAAAAFSTAPVRAASTHVLTYLKQQCGIDFTGGATAPTSAP
jgi:hypothetical protein